MAFPNAPTLGERYYTHTQTWEWDGANWVQVYGVDDSAMVRVNPDEPIPSSALAGDGLVYIRDDELSVTIGASTAVAVEEIDDPYPAIIFTLGL